MLQYWATDFYAPVLSVGVENVGDMLIYAISDSHTGEHKVQAKVQQDVCDLLLFTNRLLSLLKFLQIVTYPVGCDSVVMSCSVLIPVLFVERKYTSSLQFFEEQILKKVKQIYRLGKNLVVMQYHKCFNVNFNLFCYFWPGGIIQLEQL